MRKNILMLGAVVLSANSALAAGVEERSTQLQSALQGNHSYEAYVARDLASIAEDEKSQHDTDVARAFMDLAEQYAQKAGAK